jgi:hypothetical protein
MGTHRPARQILLVTAAGISIAGLAACSSSSNPPPATPSPTAPATTSAPASSTGGSAAAVSEITANWEGFFSGSTAAAKKITLLQNGQAFSSVIDGQAGSAMSKSTTAKVLSVTPNSTGTQASVKYTILFGGTPALSNQTGTAINESGTWKVGDATFCQLLALENNGKAPSVCSSAG